MNLGGYLMSKSQRRSFEQVIETAYDLGVDIKTLNRHQLRGFSELVWLAEKYVKGDKENGKRNE